MKINMKVLESWQTYKINNMWFLVYNWSKLYNVVSGFDVNSRIIQLYVYLTRIPLALIKINIEVVANGKLTR